MEAARCPETLEPPSLITKQPTPEDNILSWSWRQYNYVLRSFTFQIKSCNLMKEAIYSSETLVTLCQFLKKLKEIFGSQRFRGFHSSQRGTESAGRRNQWDTVLKGADMPRSIQRNGFCWQAGLEVMYTEWYLSFHSPKEP